MSQEDYIAYSVRKSVCDPSRKNPVNDEIFGLNFFICPTNSKQRC